MRSNVLCPLVLASVSACWAQTASPVLLGASHVNPFPLKIAPGQLLTLIVEATLGATPVASSNISVTYSDGTLMPVVQVILLGGACMSTLTSQCAEVMGVTVQVPFGISVFCTLCANPLPAGGNIVVSVDGVTAFGVGVQPLQDQVHFLTSCDLIVSGVSTTPPIGGLPCTPIITHGDGRPVSAILPAKAGEELVAYATGLGATNPVLTTGQPAARSSPTVTAFGIDFNFRPNALATQPSAVGVPTSVPLFTGATKGYVGLYQINFIVPPPLAGLPPCVDFSSIVAGGIAVTSNLTVSVGSNYSFDGAGICVTPIGS
jgi:uncharacterized protein (TIGR03437 family)